MTADPFTPRVPTKKEAEGIDWCHIFDGVVHCAGWLDGWLTTLTEDENGVECCYGQSALDLAVLRPWRDRKLFHLPVCPHCESALDEEQSILEAYR